MQLALISIGLWFVIFSMIKGSSGVDRAIRGGGDGGDPPAPEPIDPLAQARANLQAQIETLPRAAQVQYDILSDPNIGLQAQTQLAEDVRKNVFGGEQAVRERLVQNVLNQLTSPSGITPEQQAAIDLRRGQAQGDLTEALRTRANLGGGLFGGRSARTEERAVRDLQAQFSEEDINREERNRLNNAQLALSIMGVLFPNVGLQQPQFINPVASADTQFSGAVNQSNLAAQLQSQQDAQNAAMRSSLFKALGNVGGQAIGAAGQAGGFGNLFG